MTRTVRLVAGPVVTFAAMLFCGCPGGSSGSGGGSTSVTPTITGGTLSCNPTDIMSGQTSACTTTVTGTGNFNSAVTWNVSAGTFAAGATGKGTYTAPETQTTLKATVTAISVQDPSKKMNVTITVRPLVTALASVNPDVVALTAETVLGGIVLRGSGFAAGQTLHITLCPDLVLQNGTDPSEIKLALAFDTPHYSPGPFHFWITKPGDPAGAPADKTKLPRISFVGDQNTGTVDPASGRIFHLDQASGTLYKFRADGTPDGSIPVGALRHSVAFDNASGRVVVDATTYDPAQTDGFSWRGAGGSWNSALVTGAAAKDGYSCFSRPHENLIACYDLTGPVTFPDITKTSQAIPDEPWAQAMVRMGSELSTLVYARAGTPRLWRVSVPDMQVRGSVATSTAAVDDGTAGTTSGCWLIAFDSGPAAGTAVLLTHADAMLTFIDIASLTVRKQVKLTDHFGTTMHPFRLAADPAHGAVIVAVTVPGPGADLTRFASVDATSGSITDLAQTSKNLAVSFVVSPDGTKMYSCHRGERLESLPTQNRSTATAAAATAARGSGAAMASAMSFAGASPATPAAPELEFSASRKNVRPGEGIVLRWKAYHASELTASGDWDSPEKVTNTAEGAQVMVRRETGEYNFILSARGQGGSVAKSVTVRVAAHVEPSPEIAVSVPDWAHAGQPTSVSLITKGADECSVSTLFGTQAIPANGSGFFTPPIPGRFAATVTCEGPGGSASRTTALTVSPF